jgi:membrane-bound lytic murein transglycosylase D
MAVSLALAAQEDARSPGTDDPSPSPAALPFRRSARPPEGPGTGSVPSHAAEMVFDMPMDLDRPEVRKKLEEYSSPGGRAWLAAVMRKSDPYRDYVASRIREMGLPRELLYLPVIESEYRPDAVSRSGAAGIWQFMRNSISGYGMRIDEWRDDRRDFMKSTDAALKKLKYNHEVLKDWRLALSAYNHGLNGVKRAIAKAGTGDFWELCEKGALPIETMRYVPKFMAIAAVLSYGGRRGMEAAWPDTPSWTVLALDRPVDLGLLAGEAGLSLETLRAGNAELRYNVTPPGGAGWALKVRAEDENSVRAVLDDPSTKLIRYYLYPVKSGDTLSALSRHYGVPVSSILSGNPGLKPSLLRIGSTIIIPAMKDVSPYEGRKAANADLPFTGSYAVAKGDSLWSISLRYGVQPELLAERNGLGLSSILREGSVLKVPINE